MQSNQLILIGGGCRSGKSSFALSLARRLGRRRIFLATGQAGDEEMQQRILRHRQTRGDDFRTVEEPLAIAELIRTISNYDVLVVDCLTLWLANLLSEGKDEAAILARVEDLVAVLDSRPLHIVLVTNEVGLGIVPETALGRTFRDLSGSAHQRLSRLADVVYFAVLGTMLRIKPGPICHVTEADA